MVPKNRGYITLWRISHYIACNPRVFGVCHMNLELEADMPKMPFAHNCESYILYTYVYSLLCLQAETKQTRVTYARRFKSSSVFCSVRIYI